jgi:type II secretory pathway pseudopilin PulG
MVRGIKQPGFSVAEVMIAVGILGVALIFIAGVFPVGIRFTEVSTNRTVGTIVASEAFAKIRLMADEIGVDFTDLQELEPEEHRDFNDWCDEIDISDDYLLDVNTYSYPTDNTIKFENKHYCWSALLRRVDRYISGPNEPDSSRDVQVTVFVYRKASQNAKYYQHDANDLGSDDYGQILDIADKLPGPVRIEVRDVQNRDNELQIDKVEEKTLINDGDLIVDDRTGRIYRVLERYTPPNDHIILLDKDFNYYDADGDSFESEDWFVWVVPAPWAPGTGSTWRVSGKNPCIGVYQKVIKF